MKLIIQTLFFLHFIFLSCQEKKEVFVNFSNPEIDYSGRVNFNNKEGAEIYWAGSSIKMNFEGESVSAILKDESGDNYYNVIIDDKLEAIIQPDTIQKTYTLAYNLSKGKHTVELFRRNDWNRGKTQFFGFKINNHAKLLPKAESTGRKIEFYGDSISVGYANEDTSGADSPLGLNTNNYLSYAALVSRHYDAKYQCICKSGTGVAVSWHPLTMSELHNRLVPTQAQSIWDFSLYQPEIVVLNLFQNDSWLVNLPKHKEFKKRFGTTAPTDKYIVGTYESLVSKIRNHYPQANIICTLGSMDAVKNGSKWRDFIELAVRNMKDQKIFMHYMPYNNSKGHPSISDHQQMANSLIKFIDQNIKWSANLKN